MAFTVYSWFTMKFSSKSFGASLELVSKAAVPSGPKAKASPVRLDVTQYCNSPNTELARFLATDLIWQTHVARQEIPCMKPMRASQLYWKWSPSAHTTSQLPAGLKNEVCSFPIAFSLLFPDTAEQSPSH